MSDKRAFTLRVLDWPSYLGVGSSKNRGATPARRQPHQSTSLDSLDLEVQAGEHVVIVGASGSGKSTLIKKYAEAQHLDNFSSSESSSSVGLLLQEGALFDHLNVCNNLELVLRHASGPTVSQSRILNCFESLNLDPSLLERRVSELSGGQMRRVAIARAILLEPQVMLYDEPDAGLDVANLVSLARLVTSLLGKESAAMTVSHNPIYIARIATRVVELKNAELYTLLEWPAVADSEAQAQRRQSKVIESLCKLENLNTDSKDLSQKVTQAFNSSRMGKFSTSLFNVMQGLLQPTRSLRDSLNLFVYGLYLSFFSGMLFFALVGLMLGATTLAVVHLLATSALTGWVTWLVSSEDILKLMGGRYALYLGPAVGSMLFAARSGSLVTSWLGRLVLSRQLEAMRFLSIPVNAYVITPVMLASMLGTALNIVWFSAAVWLGGAVAARELFESEYALQLLNVSLSDIQQSSVVLKTLIYSVSTGIIFTSFALINKTGGDELNRDTTSAIVWSTILVALVELLIILY